MALPIQLQADETVVLQVHRHIVFLYMRMTRVILAAIVPIILAILLNSATDNSTISSLLNILIVIWALVWIVVIYFTWYRYNHDEWIITNQRIVDSVKRHWFHHKISSADLVNVEDMSVTMEGVLPTIFKFGSLRCQTAGKQDNFSLIGIPEPTRVLDVVDKSRDEARRKLVQLNAQM